MEKQVAKKLLEIEAVFLKPNSPFTWASGIKSPIYCDNRLTLSHPEVRDMIEEGLVELIRNNFPDAEAIFGTATAGIAHAALVANILNLPMGYARGTSKGHGRTNKIEGKISKGQKVVVIEDLISTAGSVIEIVNTLKEAGAEVLGIVSIFTYGLQKGIDNLERNNIKNISLSNYDALIEAAIENDYISVDDVAKLQKFRANPTDDSWRTL